MKTNESKHDSLVRHAFAVAAFLLVLAIAGCGRTPSSYTGQIRAFCPSGWQVSASNDVIMLRRENPVWIMGKVSNPPIMPNENVAAYFQRCGQQIHYEVRLRFVPLLSQTEFEKLQTARQQAAARLAHGASGKSEYNQLQIEYENCQVPQFFTETNSIFVERWVDAGDTKGYHFEPDFIEVYPPEAGLEIEAVIKSLGKVFKDYESGYGSVTSKDAGATAEEDRSYTSPDGRFKMVVYRTPLPIAMPGQSGDAPGFVRLYEVKSGRILEQKDVQMVQLIDQFEWSPTNLYIKFFADWKLPP